MEVTTKTPAVSIELAAQRANRPISLIGLLADRRILMAVLSDGKRTCCVDVTDVERLTEGKLRRLWNVSAAKARCRRRAGKESA